MFAILRPQTTSLFVVLITTLCSNCGCQETTQPRPAINEQDWTLVWNDEFDGAQLDESKWKFETGAHGWGNSEWQNYTDGDNASVGGGILKITAKKIGAGQKPGDYSSTRLNSKQSFTYGRMEVRAKLPKHQGNGLWPAIWMLGDNISKVGWPQCGELDIMEYVSYLPNNIHSAIHCKSHNHGDGTQVESGPKKLETAEEDFHIYGMIWSETSVKFYVDDPANVHLTYDRPKQFNDQNWPFSKPHFFLLNVAVGGGWGGQKGVDDSIFPATMEIDFVRVYKQK